MAQPLLCNDTSDDFLNGSRIILIKIYYTLRYSVLLLMQFVGITQIIKISRIVIMTFEYPQKLEMYRANLN